MLLLTLIKRPWIVFGQYLTIQPWTLVFNPYQSFPFFVMAWIQIPDLPGYLYNKKILEEIGGLIRKVTKLNFNTDNGLRGWFARMAIFVNLDKLLISKILINGNLQRIEYEFLPSICFSCGRYGHVKELCPISVGDKDLTGENEKAKMAESTVGVTVEDTTEFGPWMVVKRSSRQSSKEFRKTTAKNPVSIKGRDEVVGPEKDEGGVSKLGHESKVGLGKQAEYLEGNSNGAGSSKVVGLQLGSLKYLGVVAGNNPVGKRPLGADGRVSFSSGPKRPNYSGGPHLNATSHYNPTFEGPIEMGLTLNSNVLDPMKHSAVVFTDHIGINDNDSLEVSDPTNSESGVSTSKLRGTVGNGITVRKGRVLNKTIKDRSECFKIVKNTKVSLLDSINSMVGLINSHIDTRPNNVVAIPNSKHRSIRSTYIGNCIKIQL
ncbi:hypothetical protein Goshw_028192 [Gossypium schwendimanii]|uniref:CCHC-type domain-containing protein n=1 Tax=Gossypium schwendimanii TaxID=34291 RepID=A0A7J9MLK3_GOSSC|nr:hypothetical protein [Gossypium schwendimanii]